MSLPVSKTALDRLGTKLIAGDQVMEADRAVLAQVAAGYQQALEKVKARLAELGYPCTTRVKTTGTLVEKLRREAPMRLSQVQDLAGARIIVKDRLSQDEAVRVIGEDCASSSRRWKVMDRRDHPSHGYRAVHLIIVWDQIPVEVQVRTELQDTWAQMTERVADRWGRGIRYGEGPDSPGDSGDALKMLEARRSVVGSLMTLGDTIAQAEAMVVQADSSAMVLEAFGKSASNFERSRAGDHRTVREAIPEESLASIVNGVERLGPEAQAAMAGCQDLTMAEFGKALHQAQESTRQKNDAYRDRLYTLEDRLRAALQKIADVADRKDI